MSAFFQNPYLRRPGMMNVARRFDEYYRCYPLVMMPGPDRENLNHGGKVFLPPSALDKLTRLHITYPMLFELINGARERKTHAGVLEFTAEEGKIYLPQWVSFSGTRHPHLPRKAQTRLTTSYHPDNADPPPRTRRPPPD
jgi:ubiquitin fusion degradation protein 1